MASGANSVGARRTASLVGESRGARGAPPRRACALAELKGWCALNTSGELRSLLRRFRGVAAGVAARLSLVGPSSGLLVSRGNRSRTAWDLGRSVYLGEQSNAMDRRGRMCFVSGGLSETPMSCKRERVLNPSHFLFPSPPIAVTSGPSTAPDPTHPP